MGLPRRASASCCALILAAVSLVCPTASRAACDFELVSGSLVKARPNPRGLSIADVDGDGIRDVVVVNTDEAHQGADGSVAVYYGDPFGTLSDPVIRPEYRLPLIGGPASVLAKDLTGDGRIDLVIGHQIGLLYLHRGQVPDEPGDWPFADPVLILDVPSPFHINASDLDGDGIDDLIIASYIGSGRLNILRGLGNGAYLPSLDLSVGSFPASTQVGDFDENGVADIAVSLHGDDAVAVLLGQGSGSFQPATIYAAGDGPFGLVARDLNGDGVTDLATACYFDNPLGGTAILLGRGVSGIGDGTFGPAQRIVGASGTFLGPADLNGDGATDLLSVGAQETGAVTVLLANTTDDVPDGTFQVHPLTLPRAVLAYAAAFEDLDRDGRPDLVVAPWGSDHVSVYRGACSDLPPPVATAAIWASDGIPVCRAQGNQALPAVAADGMGGAFVTWEDRRNGIDFDAYAQHVDFAGNTSWTTDGMLVAGGSGHQREAFAAPDSAGGAYVAWTDYAVGAQVRLNRLTGFGDPAFGWPAEGIRLFGSFDVIRTPRLAADGTGGVYVVVEDVENGYRIAALRVLHIMSNGERAPGWPENGVVVTTADASAGYFIDSPVIAAAGSHLYVAFHQLRISTIHGESRYIHTHEAVRVGPGPVRSWVSRADLVIPRIPAVTADASGNAYMGGGNGGLGFYMQPTQYLPSWMRFYDTLVPPILSSLAVDGLGGVFGLASPIAPDSSDFLVTYMRSSGVVGDAWPQTGVVTSAPGIGNPVLIPDSGGQAVAFWDQAGAGHRDLFFRVMTPTGHSRRYPAPTLLTAAPGDQKSLVGAASAYRSVIVAWMDDRDPENGSDIYAQRIVTDDRVPPVLAADPPSRRASSIELRIVSSNPVTNGVATVRVRTSSLRGCLLECFDAFGRRRWSHTVGSPDGQAIRVPTRGWQSGLYWIRAQDGRSQRTARLVVLQ